ncbi:MAG: hypothetical protein KVP17_002765 [Porospora cf. gigantea B]|uniref:uncharacterized protein n=2 Tax=Porospora cf. gigantea B TaxID=2853592 RepID=UPI003571E58B|nr:MAG: hypothetical protein KVP17_002765 [Porospora cf. gigantea B]
MDDIRALLGLAGATLGRTSSQMEPFVTKLADNWFDSVDALRGLSEAQWTQMGFPLRLVEAIRSELGDSQSDPTQRSAITPPNLSEVNYEPPTEEQIPVNVQESLNVYFEDATMDIEDRVLCTQTLLKLIDAVIEQPRNPAKRRINLANEAFHLRVGRFPSTFAVLHCVGFFETADRHLQMPTAFVSRLTDLHSHLDQHAQDLGLPKTPLPSTFNPYAVSVKLQTPLMSRVLDERAEAAERVKERIEEVKRLQETGGVDHVEPNPQVYHLNALRRHVQSPRRDSGNDLPPTSKDLDRIKQLAEGPAFKSRQQVLLEEMEERGSFPKCTLRIVLPNELVLQIDMKPSARVADVIALASQFLTHTARECWELYSTPPPTVLETRKTLYQLGLVPAATVRYRALRPLANERYLRSDMYDSATSSAALPRPETNERIKKSIRSKLGMK